MARQKAPKQASKKAKKPSRLRRFGQVAAWTARLGTAFALATGAAQLGAVPEKEGVSAAPVPSAPQEPTLTKEQLCRVRDNLQLAGHVVGNKCEMDFSMFTALEYFAAKHGQDNLWQPHPETLDLLEREANYHRAMAEIEEDDVALAAIIQDICHRYPISGDPDIDCLYLGNNTDIESAFGTKLSNTVNRRVRGLNHFDPDTFLFALYEGGDRVGLGHLADMIVKERLVKGGKDITLPRARDPRLTDDLIDMRNDPHISLKVTNLSTQKFRDDVLRVHGLETGPADWYLEHVVGPSGGREIQKLRAQGKMNTSIWSVFPEKVIQDNPFVFRVPGKSLRATTLKDVRKHLQAVFSKPRPRYRAALQKYERVKRSDATLMAAAPILDNS